MSAQVAANLDNLKTWLLATLPPKGLALTTVLEKYEQSHHVALKPADFGFGKIKMLIKYLETDTVSVLLANDGGVMLIPRARQSLQSNKDASSSARSPPPLPTDLDGLRQFYCWLLRDNAVVEVDKSFSAFEQAYGVKLNPQTFGNPRMKGLLRDLSDTIEVDRADAGVVLRLVAQKSVTQPVTQPVTPSTMVSTKDSRPNVADAWVLAEEEILDEEARKSGGEKAVIEAKESRRILKKENEKKQLQEKQKELEDRQKSEKEALDRKRKEEIDKHESDIKLQLDADIAAIKKLGEDKLSKKGRESSAWDLAEKEILEEEAETKTRNNLGKNVGIDEMRNQEEAARALKETQEKEIKEKEEKLREIRLQEEKERQEKEAMDAERQRQDEERKELEEMEAVTRRLALQREQRAKEDQAWRETEEAMKLLPSFLTSKPQPPSTTGTVSNNLEDDDDYLDYSGPSSATEEISPPPDPVHLISALTEEALRQKIQEDQIMHRVNSGIAHSAMINSLESNVTKNPSADVKVKNSPSPDVASDKDSLGKFSSDSAALKASRDSLISRIRNLLFLFSGYFDTLDTFCDTYSKNYGEVLPLLNFKDSFQLLSSMSDVVRLERTQSGEWSVHAVLKASPVLSSSPLKRSSSSNTSNGTASPTLTTFASTIASPVLASEHLNVNSVNESSSVVNDAKSSSPSPSFHNLFFTLTVPFNNTATNNDTSKSSPREFFRGLIDTKTGSFQWSASPLSPPDIPSRCSRDTRGTLLKDGSSIAAVSDFRKFLPSEVSKSLEQHVLCDNLLEVTLDVGCAPSATFHRPCSFFSRTKEDLLHQSMDNKMIVTTGFSSKLISQADVDRSLSLVPPFSRGVRLDGLHRFSPLGYDSVSILNASTTRSENVGTNASASSPVSENVGVTCRVGRVAPHKSLALWDLLASRKDNILITGAALSGKSTLIRDCARFQSDVLGKRVVVVDTFHDLGGDGRGAHPSLGHSRRLLVGKDQPQHSLISDAAWLHSAEVIIIDMLLSVDDVDVVLEVMQRGVRVIAGVSGTCLLDVAVHPFFCLLLFPELCLRSDDNESRSSVNNGQSRARTFIPPPSSLPSLPMRFIGVVLECYGCFQAYVHDIAGEFQSRDDPPQFPFSLMGSGDDADDSSKVAVDSALWSTELRHLHVTETDDPSSFYIHSSVEACLCTSSSDISKFQR